MGAGARTARTALLGGLRASELMLYKNVWPLKSPDRIAILSSSLSPPSPLSLSLFAAQLAGKKHLKLLHTSTTAVAAPSTSSIPSPASALPASPLPYSQFPNMPTHTTHRVHAPHLETPPMDTSRRFVNSRFCCEINCHFLSVSRPA